MTPENSRVDPWWTPADVVLTENGAAVRSSPELGCDAEPLLRRP
jgi:hypothetical protein